MKIALDTNVLAYAERVDDDFREGIVTTLLEPIPRNPVVIPAQVLGESFNVLVR